MPSPTLFPTVTLFEGKKGLQSGQHTLLVSSRTLFPGYSASNFEMSWYSLQGKRGAVRNDPQSFDRRKLRWLHPHFSARSFYEEEKGLGCVQPFTSSFLQSISFSSKSGSNTSQTSWFNSFRGKRATASIMILHLKR